MTTKVSDERLAELAAKHQEHYDYTVKILPQPVEWERKVIQESADWLSALRELQEKRALVKESEPYLRHKNDCQVDWPFGGRVECTCGLDALLARVRGEI